MAPSESPEVSERIHELAGTTGCDEEDVLLALQMAEDLRNASASPYLPYLAALPSEEALRQYHPAYLDEGLLDLGDDINIWQFLRGMLGLCYDQYRARVPGDLVTIHEAYAALVLIRSRKFDVPLLPAGLDLANAAPPQQKNTHGAPVGDDLFCMEALRDLAVGEEILFPYSASNASAIAFFQTYGFAFDPDDHSRTALCGPKGVDPCEGLRAEEFKEPEESTNPVLWNYWRFAVVHCQTASRGGMRGRRAQLDDL